MNWNERYSIDEWLFGIEPSEFLVSHKDLLIPGTNVLTIGDGEGRNGVWLAKQGLNVTSLEISSVAVEKAKKLAQQENVTMNAQCQDIVTWDWPLRYFDAIVCIFVHLPSHQRQDINKKIIASLKHCGIFFLEAFDKKQLDYDTGGPKDEGMLLSEGTIKKEFQSLEILHLSTQETEVYCHDGPNARGCSVQFVGRRLLNIDTKN